MGNSTTAAGRSLGPAKPGWLLGTVVLTQLLVGLAAFVVGFVFVQRAQGGFWMGAAAGLNAALFATLLLDGLFSRLARRSAGRR
jgi:hypothetical protein